MVNLAEFEKKTFSQNGEDGVLKAIFDMVGETNRYYVEFGAGNGDECNTRHLREYFNWSGLLMDAGRENQNINLHREFITSQNINFLFQKYSVPKEFDLLSIDIDFNDWHIWHALDISYRPRVVVIEYNGSHPPDQDRVVRYDPNELWDGTDYYGASILALFRLGSHKGYSLVYAESKGVNLFFIRNDIIDECKAKGIQFPSINDVIAIYHRPKYGNAPMGDHMGGHPQDHLDRAYTDSSACLRYIPVDHLLDPVALRR